MRDFSTYSKDDVIFLLKDISNLIEEEGNKERELKIQNGRHYSEMIPIEYEVSEDYLNLYHEKLRENKDKLAFSIGVMCEKIIKKNGNDVVLVSLAIPPAVWASCLRSRRLSVSCAMIRYPISMAKSWMSTAALSWIDRKRHGRNLFPD